jgi:hypothetical protein
VPQFIEGSIVADPYDINPRMRRPGAGYGGFQSEDGAFLTPPDAPPEMSNRAPVQPGSKFQLPKVPGLDAGAPSLEFRATPKGNGMRTPSFITPRKRDPMFDNVESHSDTVPGSNSNIDLNHQYTTGNAPPSLEATNANYGNLAPRSVSGDTRGAEAERQKALSGINDALFGLRGNLNMRSKREMLTNLLGEKNKLTSQAYDTQNSRDMTGAKFANEAAQQNATLQEQGAKRRDDINSFNVQEGDRRDMAAAELADKRQARADAAPFKALQAKAIESQIETAGVQRDIAKAGAGIKSDKYNNEVDDARRKQLMADNPGASSEQIDQMRAKEDAAMGIDPGSTMSGARGDAAIANDVRGKINQGDNWLTELLTGAPHVGINNDEQLNTINPDEIKVTRNSGVLPAIMRFGSALTPGFDYDAKYGYRVGVPGQFDGMNSSTSIGEDEAMKLKEYQAQRAAAKRRSQP